jgi:hypothetical protein
MWFRLVIIAQLSIKVVGGNVEFWLGAGSLNSSWLVLYMPDNMLINKMPLHITIIYKAYN